MKYRSVLFVPGHEEKKIKKAYTLNADLIVLDLDMPKMDGFEFIERAQEDGIKIPIVVFSGKDITAVEEKMLSKFTEGIVKKESKVNEYTYGKGDIVKDINPTCPHYGAVGKVKSVNPKSVVFVVMNKGKKYKPGDVLDKTHDQMTQMIPQND